MGKTGSVVIVVFAKTPRSGFVKTRLIGVLTAGQAAETHDWMTQAVLAQVQEYAAGARVLAVSPDDGAGAFAAYWPTPGEIVGQGDGDLGTRLARVTQGVFERHGAPMIIIGTDSPDLPAARFAEAARIISAGACAMCAARDGGYCLLAIPAPRPALFAGIDWGSTQVADQTRAAARNAEIELCELEPWEDVDTVDDVRRLGERLRSAENRALGELRRRLVSAKLVEP